MTIREFKKLYLTNQDDRPLPKWWDGYFNEETGILKGIPGDWQVQPYIAFDDNKEFCGYVLQVTTSIPKGAIHMYPVMHPDTPACDNFEPEEEELLN